MGWKYQRENAVESGEIEGHRYYIVPYPGGGRLNGYLAFPQRPVRERGYGGILAYVPVHGGITFAREDEEGVCYGFDTGHFNSENYPINDTEWIKGQIRIMLKGIQKAAEVESEYLALDETDVEGRAPFCDAVREVGIAEGDVQELGFLPMIRLLTGRL